MSAIAPPEKPQPPRKPEPYECCGTGCIPCVMDVYEEALWEYEKALEAFAGSPPG
jgi:Oxidoreductase-like protein, N-terminal